MLNDRFGIQTRGGCSCAGTYGHYLLNVDKEQSHKITSSISQGDCSLKPGWIRFSIHPTQTDQEVQYICDSIQELARHFEDWKDDYACDYRIGSIKAKDEASMQQMEQYIDRTLTQL